MPITSTKTTSIPGLPSPTTPDLISYGLGMGQTFPPSGVTAGSMILNIIPYRAEPETGANPVPVGLVSRNVLGELEAFAAANPDLAPLLAQVKIDLDAFVQAFVNKKGL